MSSINTQANLYFILNKGNKVNRYRFFYFLRQHQCGKLPPPARCSNHRCFYIDQCVQGHRTGIVRFLCGGREDYTVMRLKGFHMISARSL